MAYLLRPNGDFSEVVPANPETGFTLEELYRWLDCSTVQTLSIPATATRKAKILVIDEEGKFKEPILPNPRATAYAVLAGIAEDDFIVGNALLCSTLEIQ